MVEHNCQNFHEATVLAIDPTRPADGKEKLELPVVPDNIEKEVHDYGAYKESESPSTGPPIPPNCAQKQTTE